MFCGNHDDDQCQKCIVGFGHPGEEHPNIRETKEITQGDHGYLFINSRVDQESQGECEKVQTKCNPKRIVVQQLDLFNM